MMFFENIAKKSAPTCQPNIYMGSCCGQLYELSKYNRQTVLLNVPDMKMVRSVENMHIADGFIVALEVENFEI
jgi:hypothetical protein